MSADTGKYAEAQQMCAAVCEHYGLSAESTKMALEDVQKRPRGAWSCYRAILNSLTWERK